MSFPWDQINNGTYIEMNGLSGSVMDYLAMNIPPNVSGLDLKSHYFFTPTVGLYDYNAVGFGYTRGSTETFASKI